MGVVAGVFLAMAARWAWAARLPWDMPLSLIPLRNAVAAIDRFAFLLASALTVLAWFYIRTRPLPVSIHRAWHEQLTRYTLLCHLATEILAISALSDGVLTLIRLAGGELSRWALALLLVTATEAVGVGLLIFYIRRMAQRVSSARCLVGE